MAAAAAGEGNSSPTNKGGPNSSKTKTNRLGGNNFNSLSPNASANKNAPRLSAALSSLNLATTLPHQSFSAQPGLLGPQPPPANLVVPGTVSNNNNLNVTNSTSIIGK